MSKKGLSVDEKAQQILLIIATEGKSLRQAINEVVCPTTKAHLSYRSFYEWLEDAEKGQERQKQFARAREMRECIMFDEIQEIADNTCEGEVVKTRVDDKGMSVETERSDMIAHRKLRIYARLQMLSRMNPKKYSERHIIEGGDTPVEVVTIFRLPDNGRDKAD